MNDQGKTKIPYVTQTWETTGGCTKCSDGCRGCYAIRQIWRLAHNPVTGDKYKGLVKKANGKYQWTGKVKLFDGRLEQPLHWKAPRTIFVNPRSDTFHPSVPFEFVDKMMKIIEHSYRHTFLILTKRPKRMLHYMKGKVQARQIVKGIAAHTAGTRHAPSFPPKNLWLGTTVCNQAEADKNIPILLQIPAAKRWLSIEPMLEEIDLFASGALYFTGNLNEVGQRVACMTPSCKVRQARGAVDWVVVGCESGPNRRPCKIEWIESIIEQCKAAGVKCYVKQIDLNGKVEKDINKFPAQLQVRQKVSG